VIEKVLDAAVYKTAKEKCFIVKGLNPEAFLIQIEQALKNETPTPQSFFEGFVFKHLWD
jgi:hypothetical protein